MYYIGVPTSHRTWSFLLCYRRDPTLHDVMECNINNHRTTWPVRADLAAAIRNTDAVLHRATPDVCAKSWSYEAVLMENAVTTVKDEAQAFMERVSDAHTVNGAAEHMVGIFVENDSSITEHKPQPLSKLSLVRRPTREARLRMYWTISVSCRKPTFRR